MALSFYGGVNEIGGNKILVDDQNSFNMNDSLDMNTSSLFLDFGMSFSKAGDYFSEFLQPRKLNGILDFVELGLLPKIKGIYREDYLKHCGLNSYEEPNVDGVLLSHAHMDHCAYIHHLREDIPIFMRKESEIILKVLEETGKSSFAEIINLKKSFHYIPKKRGDGYKRLIGKDAKVERDIVTVDSYSPFEVNGFKVTSIPVDHSLPGSSAYFLENDNEAIVYSGDIRFHGRNRFFSDKFVSESQKFNPTIMICEGTRINENSNKRTEEDIEIEATNLIKYHKGLAIVNYPIRDLDRLITFYNVAKNTDRILAINSKQAYMLELLKNEKGIEKDKYPKLSDPNMAVYFPRRKQGLISGEHYVCYDDRWKILDSNDSEVEKEYEIWEREFLENDNVITYKNLREDPQDYIFRCDFFELSQLIDIRPENGIYFHSLTEPFNEEMEIDFKRVLNWLERFNLLPYHPLHVSGHGSGEEILNMIREINPEKIYPIHTEHIESFDILKDDGIEVVRPEIKL